MHKDYMAPGEHGRGERANLYANGRSVDQEQLFALLVSGENHWRGNLEEFLRARQMSFGNAQNFGELANALDQTQPDVIITAANLPDGTWRDIAGLVERSEVPTSIVVVAERSDSRPYLSAAIDCGAFDFIHPPFVSEMQACVIHVAARDTRRRREAQAFQTLNYLV